MIQAPEFDQQAPGQEVFGEAAFQAAASASEAQMDHLRSYLALLSEWNGVMNLVGPSALDTFWRRHAWDSAQLLSVAPNARRWADIGAGAGFPGLVLSILLMGEPTAQIHLIESVTKRCRFLQAVVNALALPAKVHNLRAEDTDLTGIEIVTARACAPMSRLLGFAEPLFRQGAVGIFLKGQDAATEIADAEKQWRFRWSLLPSRSDASGNIVKVEGLARV
jgi:16S rRNA (guanine527-N7)-methyltransferase